MNIGLVLSGGMAKGAFQVGALRAISECLPPGAVNLISASSVGVLNAYAFATGQLDQAEQLWEDVCSDGCRRSITQMLRSSLLQSNIHQLVSGRNIAADAFYCTLLDIRRRKVIYKNLRPIPPEEIKPYLRASVAMPIYNRAVEIGSSQYYDGAMVDNIPVYPLMRHQLDYLICIYFDDVSYQFENAYFDNKIIKIIYPSRTVVSQSLFFRKEGIHEMICDGYRQTQEIMQQVLADGWDDIPSVYKRIESLDSSTSKSLRITGDIFVTNLNRLTQKLAARKLER